jgi:hypothetical protein
LQASAWGTLSMREARLHWHGHFIQKLESQPDLEFRELHPLTAGLRSSDRGGWRPGPSDAPNCRSWMPACGRC